MTLAGPSAVFVDGTVENWLRSRMTDREMIHVVNIPSNPPGWSAGKWGEWYPDVLSRDGKLTTDMPKPYWQSGWLKQHDRLMAEVAAMPGRIPLVVSGDLHAIAEGRMQRSGALDFGKNPVVVILSGPLGTGDRGWPSAFPRHRRNAFDASHHGGGSEADRGERFHHRRLHQGWHHRALFPLQLSHAVGRCDRHAGAVPGDRAEAAIDSE